MMRCLRLRADGRDCGHPALADYLHMGMAPERTERVRVIFTDTRQRVIADETMWSGTIDRAPFYVREVCRRALELGASGLMVVHNHTSGDPRPSAPDLDATRNLARAGDALGIALLDHLIVSDGGRISMRDAGLLP